MDILLLLNLDLTSCNMAGVSRDTEFKIYAVIK